MWVVFTLSLSSDPVGRGEGREGSHHQAILRGLGVWKWPPGPHLEQRGGEHSSIVFS